ncbi:Cthe_2314 family HEPN domain-containing protein [Anaerospora hongkongensis]|uniref:Cthe_2314 family HEPN domain-containing protein n=1 Tax=Anaerospora hongkongensis TaxID=244830 RepID=UPI0028A1CB55|nr:Cthe_2314 family HEPN domain-containing protein [Anaerospora hongkongensis]
MKWNPIFPSSEEFFSISKEFPGDDIRESIIKVEKHNETLIENIFGIKEIEKWKTALYSKVLDIQMAYVCAVYAYNKGIPDEQWYKNDYDSGKVIYLPDFLEEHYILKSMFDFFADTFFYKLFAAFDLVGHTLNEKYQLNIQEDKLYFSTAVNKLQVIDLDLYQELNGIMARDDYKEGKIRNAFAHRIPPTQLQGMILENTSDGSSINIGEYTTSSTIKNIMDNALKAFVDTLKAISDSRPS